MSAGPEHEPESEGEHGMAPAATEPFTDETPAAVRHPGALHRGTGAVFTWMFRNRHTGQITIAQFPNVALWIFVVTVVVRWVVPTGSNLRTSDDAIAVIALATWALDEVLRGVNPWRRLLGVGGCGFVVAGVVALLR